MHKWWLSQTVFSSHPIPLLRGGRFWLPVFKVMPTTLCCFKLSLEFLFTFLPDKRSQRA